MEHGNRKQTARKSTGPRPLNTQRQTDNHTQPTSSGLVKPRLGRPYRPSSLALQQIRRYQKECVLTMSFYHPSGLLRLSLFPASQLCHPRP